MAASSKKAAGKQKEPADIPLPPSPEKKTGRKKNRQAKSHEDAPPHSNPRSIQTSPPDTWDHEKAGTSAWNWSALTESSSIAHPPVFTKDGRYFFTIVGPNIRVHSSTTGAAVSTLSVSLAAASGPSKSTRSSQFDNITCMVLNPHNVFQLITGSIGGFIRTWNFLDGDLLQTIDLQRPIFFMDAHEKWKNTVYAGTHKAGKDGVNSDTCQVFKVSLFSYSSTIVKTSSEIIAIGKTRFLSGLKISPSGDWIVAIAYKRAYIGDLANPKGGFTKYVSPEFMSCLAFHPTDDIFVTGDEKGVVRTWHCLKPGVMDVAFGVEKKAQTSAYTWHAHRVSSVAFTSNGAYILSGGEEAVLVIWSVANGRKEFIPRVGSAIASIAVAKEDTRAEEYLLTLSDSSFVFINSAEMKVSRSYSRLRLDPEAKYGSSRSKAPLAYHSHSSTIILPASHPSSLQVYDPTSSTVVSEIEISPSNRVRGEHQVEPSRVEHVVTSPDGQWLATVDVRAGDADFHDEIYLKIWQWDDNTRRWNLNSRIDRPHGTNAVVSFAFSSTSIISTGRLVTAAKDGTVKIWVLYTSSKKEDVAQTSWGPGPTFKVRADGASHVSWAQDGSAIAVTGRTGVQVYDPARNTTLASFACTENCSILSSSFLGNSGRYIVAVGVWDVILWDVISRTVRWHHRSQWPVDSLAPHSTENTFAIVHCLSVSPVNGEQTTPISVYRVNMPTPVRKHTIPYCLLNVAALPSKARETFGLVGITNTYNVVLFGDEVNSTSFEGERRQTLSKDTVASRPTLFQDIFGVAAFDPTNKRGSHVDAVSSADGGSTSKSTLKLFEGPSHLMPGMSIIFDGLINNYLTPRKTDSDAPTDDADEKDDEMNVDEISGDTPAIVTVSQSRQWTEADTSTFVDLFKRLNARSQPAVTVNGTTKLPNGVLHDKALKQIAVVLEKHPRPTR